MKLVLTMFLALGLVLTGCKAEEEKAAIPSAPVVDAPAVAEQAAPKADEVAIAEPAVAEKAAEAVSADVSEAASAVVADTKKAVEEKVADTVAKTPVVATAKEIKPVPEKVVKPVVPVVAPKPVVKKPVAVVEKVPAAPVKAVAPAIPAGDAIAGASKARKCKACHTFDAGGKHKTGPNLFDVYGRTAGKASGFSKYGNDLKGASFSWDVAALTAWLCDSKAAVKSLTGNSGAKTKMSNQRVCGTDALNVAAYLKTLK